MKRDFNLFGALDLSGETRKRVTGRVIAAIVCLAVCAVAVAAPFLYYTYQNVQLLKQMTALRVQVSDAETVRKAAQADVTSAQNAVITEYIGKAEGFISAFGSQSVFDQQTLTKIAQALGAQVTLDALSYDQGQLVLQCSAKARTNPAKCALALEETQLFSGVTYTGYDKQEDPAVPGGEAPANEPSYTFTLSCIMKGGDAQ